jgi:hypothetical protein
MTALKPRADGRILSGVRIKKLKDKRAIGVARNHALRGKGRKFVLRPRAVAGESLRWCYDGSEAEFDLWSAFKSHQKASGGRERKNGPLMLHALFIVSPEWIQAAGDLHDKNNPRNQQLFAQAMACAREEIGGLVAARLDLDELGGGVVDIFCSPVFNRQAKLKKDGTRGEPTLEISIHKAMQSVFQRHKTDLDETETGAFQNCWALWAQSHLDPKIERGDRKAKTGRPHLLTPDFKLQQDGLADMQDSLTAALDLKLKTENEVHAAHLELDDLQFRALNIKADIADREAGIAGREQAVSTDETAREGKWRELDERSAVQDVQASALVLQQSILDAERADLDRAIVTLSDETRALAATKEALRIDSHQLTADRAAFATERQDMLEEQSILEADRRRVADDRAAVGKDQQELDEKYEAAYVWYETEANRLTTRQTEMDAAEAKAAAREAQLTNAEIAMETEKARLMEVGQDVQRYSLQAITNESRLLNRIERVEEYERSLKTQIEVSAERMATLDARELAVTDRETAVDALVAARLAQRTRELDEKADIDAERLRVRQLELSEFENRQNAAAQLRTEQFNHLQRDLDRREHALGASLQDTRDRQSELETLEKELTERDQQSMRLLGALDHVRRWMLTKDYGRPTDVVTKAVGRHPWISEFVSWIAGLDQETRAARRKVLLEEEALKQRAAELEAERQAFAKEKEDLIEMNTHMRDIMFQHLADLKMHKRLAEAVEKLFPPGSAAAKAMAPTGELLSRVGNVLANFFGTKKVKDRDGVGCD